MKTNLSFLILSILIIFNQSYIFSKDYITKFYYNGREISESEFENNGKNGKVVVFRPDNTKFAETNYENGKENGIFVEYFENGQIYQSISFLNGKQHGICLTNYDNGNRASRKEYINGHQIGRIFNWFPDGSLKAKGFISFNKNHIPIYKSMIKWFESGIISVVEISIKGEGYRTEYHSNGLVFCKYSLRNGLKHGPSNCWYDTGKLMVEGEFKAGEMHSTWIHYSNDGHKVLIENLKMGVPHGLRIKFDNNGKKIKTTYYENGELIKKSLSRKKNKK